MKDTHNVYYTYLDTYINEMIITMCIGCQISKQENLKEYSKNSENANNE